MLATFGSRRSALERVGLSAGPKTAVHLSVGSESWTTAQSQPAWARPASARSWEAKSLFAACFSHALHEQAPPVHPSLSVERRKNARFPLGGVVVLGAVVLGAVVVP